MSTKNMLEQYVDDTGPVPFSPTTTEHCLTLQKEGTAAKRTEKYASRKHERILYIYNCNTTDPTAMQMRLIARSVLTLD